MRATQHRLSGRRLPDDVLRAGGFWASLYEVDPQNAKPSSKVKPEHPTLRSSRSGRQKEGRRFSKRVFHQFVRFDELFSLPIILQPMSKDEVLEVQRLYPQIYIACHTDHVRAVSTTWRISSQDASILGASTAKRV
jgi:hypothetical protein